MFKSKRLLRLRRFTWQKLSRRMTPAERVETEVEAEVEELQRRQEIWHDLVEKSDQPGA